MNDMDRLMIQKGEHQAWQSVVKVLLETGAVTEADAKAAIGKAASTRGEELFLALRWWGRWMARLGKEGIMNPEGKELL